MGKYRISGVPIVNNEDQKLLELLQTKLSLRFYFWLLNEN